MANSNNISEGILIVRNKNKITGNKNKITRGFQAKTGKV
jgi:hypothetical protein